MRRHARIWIFALLVIALFAAALLTRHRFEMRTETTTLVRTTFLLARDGGPLQFRFANTAKRFRLVSYANLPAGTKPLPGEEWNYAIAVEFKSITGRVIHETVHHHRTKLTEYREDESDEIYASGAYPSEPLVPASPRIMVVNLENHPGTAVIAVRLASADAPLVDLSVRATAREDVPKEKQAWLWDRLSPGDHRRLASNSVYGPRPELLSTVEKRALLRYRSVPLGPQGIEDKDYRVRLIELLRRNDGRMKRDVAVLPQGLLVGPARHATFPSPEPGGAVRLEFRVIDPADEHVFHIRFTGRTLAERSEETVRWNGSSFTWEKDFAPGLLEISTPGDARFALRAFRHSEPGTIADAGTNAEITPDPLYLRTAFVDDTAPVEFAVAHIGDEPAWFRADFRALFPATPGTAALPDTAPSVVVTVFDADGNRLDETTLALEEILTSFYDHLPGEPIEWNVAEPVKKFFNFPPEVARVRFHSETPLLVSAYTRPPALRHRTRVPEDYVATNEENAAEQRQPSWFSVRPLDEIDRRIHNRSPLLVVQERPPEDREEILAGNYDWEEYHPEGNWLARAVLTPRDPNSPSREEALPAAFAELTPGISRALETVAPQGLARAVPRLICLAATPLEKAAPLRLFVDGELHFAATLTTARTEFQLPPLPAGTHHFSVSAPANARCLLNHIDPAQCTVLKRTANVLNAGASVQFAYEKQSDDEELLTARFYTADDSTERTILDLRIIRPPNSAFEPAAAADQRTFTERRFSIRPPSLAPIGTEQPAAPVLDTRDETVMPGETVFIPLGTDLPCGTYTLVLDHRSGPAGYLSLSKITPGLTPRVRFLRETTP